MRNVWLPAGLFHDRAFRGLTHNSKVLFFYLHINPLSNLAGVFHLPDGYMKSDMKIRDTDELTTEFEELQQAGFVERCVVTGWVWLRRHLEFEPVRGEKQVAGFMKIAAHVPADCCWHDDFKQHIHKNIWKKIEIGQ